MTGATGDLTPESDSESTFVPGERREAADPAQHADVTLRQGRGAPAQGGEIGEPEASHGPQSHLADGSDERSDHEERF